LRVQFSLDPLAEH